MSRQVLFDTNGKPAPTVVLLRRKRVAEIQCEQLVETIAQKKRPAIFLLRDAVVDFFDGDSKADAQASIDAWCLDLAVIETELAKRASITSAETQARTQARADRQLRPLEDAIDRVRALPDDGERVEAQKSLSILCSILFPVWLPNRLVPDWCLNKAPLVPWRKVGIVAGVVAVAVAAFYATG